MTPQEEAWNSAFCVTYVTVRIAQVTGSGVSFRRNLRYRLWLLKKSFGLFAQKTRRARMPYKRFSLPRDTFLVTQFRRFCH